MNTVFIFDVQNKEKCHNLVKDNLDDKEAEFIWHSSLDKKVYKCFKLL